MDIVGDSQSFVVIDPPNKLRLGSLSRLLCFLEFAALYDRLLIPDRIGRNGQPLYGPRGSYAASVLITLQPFGFTHETFRDLVSPIDCPWDVHVYKQLEASFRVPSDQFGLQASAVAHHSMLADFAAKQGLPYALPRQDLLPFDFRVYTAVDGQITSALEAAYAHMVSALTSDQALLARLGRQVEIKIPPLAALILQRARGREYIGSALLEVREEMREAKAALGRYTTIIQDPDQPNAASLEAASDLHAVFNDLAQGYRNSKLRLLEWRDLISLPKELLNGINPDDFDSRSLVKFLVGKPLEWLLLRLRTRKCAILFRAKLHSYRASLNRDVARLFGRQALESVGG